MPLPAPLAFVFNQLRRLVITPFDPQPGFDGFLERAQTESNDRVNAYLFLPSGESKKRPAILCLHQTTNIGKDEEGMATSIAVVKFFKDAGCMIP